MKPVGEERKLRRTAFIVKLPYLYLRVNPTLRKIGVVIMYDFGLRLKALRESKGLTQADLARQLHVERATISGYESNVKTPSLPVLVNMALFFNVSTDYLLGLNKTSQINVAGISEKSINALNELISILRNLEQKNNDGQ